MASHDMGLVPSRNGMNSQLGVFLDDSVRFNCAVPSSAVAAATPQSHVGDPGPRTRELSGFLDEKLFSVDRDRYFAAATGTATARGAEFRRGVFPERQNWRGSTPTQSGDGSDEDDDDEEEEEDEEDEVDEGDGEVEALVAVSNPNHDKNGNTISSDSVHNCAPGKIIIAVAKHHCSFGSNREILPKDNNFVQSMNNDARARSIENHEQGRVRNYQNAITIAEPEGDMYYSQFLQGPEGSAAPGQKEFVVENGCSFSGRKDVADSSESGESLRAILSDPVTGSLMDDAMILPCGHSFGINGIQQVLRMKACFTCTQLISEDLVAPNLSLRAAVQAFRREEVSQSCRASRKRKERFEQDKGNYSDSFLDPPRGRGVQFPFAVTDRVIIKGNKRTPQRFVGCEAVVTTQCLNGWYVVKTLDNAESVKLQYRSLAKVSNNSSSSKPTSAKTSNWL